MNQKGGVGKTTTAVNLGAGLARSGRRVLLIDMDPQAHLSLHLGIDTSTGQAGIYEALTGQASFQEIIRPVGENLWVAPSHINMAALEVELSDVPERETILRKLMAAYTEPVDYILIDCPPSLGILTLNSLAASREVFVPLQPHFLALQGLGQLLRTVWLVAERINPRLWVTGILFCMYETGTRLAGEVVEDLKEFLRKARESGMPWSKARMFRTIVRRNIRLAECPSFGKSIFDYAPGSNGAEDYAALAREVEAMIAKSAPSPSSADTPPPSADASMATTSEESEPPHDPHPEGSTGV